MIRPKTGSQSHQGICFFLWFVVWLALSAYSPERFSHNSLPTIQQGLDLRLPPAGLLEVIYVCYVHLILFVNSSNFLDMFVRSIYRHDASAKVKVLILKGERDYVERRRQFNRLVRKERVDKYK